MGNAIRQNLKWELWLAFFCIMAAVPGYLMSPFSINTFDEPYQILNCYGWRNSVYSPLSALLGNVYGNIFAWKYIAFRRLLVILIALSVFIASLYAVRISKNKPLTIAFATFCTYFSTVFKSDMNIYGWDHWSAVFIVVCIVLSLSLLMEWRLRKIIWLGVLSALTTLLRLPNICIVLFIALLICLYGARGKSVIEILKAEIIYGVIVIIIGFTVIIMMYGSVGNYIETFVHNPVGAHSPSRILKPLFISILSIARYCAIMLAGYGTIHFVLKKINSRWIQGLVIVIITVCFFILIVPLRRNVLGNVIETGISFAILGLILIFIRGWKDSNKNESLYAVSILLLCNVVVAGSNWGIYKFMAWPAIPLIAAMCVKKWTLPLQWFSVSVGVALIAYSFYGFYRPTLDDRNYNSLTYRLSGGVLDGMYTNHLRGENIDEVKRAVEPYMENGYEVVPLRLKNEYIWEYIYLNRNEYQRHRFDNWYAYDDSEYAKWVINRNLESDHPVLIIYIDDDSDPSSLMYRTLSETFNKVGRGSRFTLFSNR